MRKSEEEVTLWEKGLKRKKKVLRMPPKLGLSKRVNEKGKLEVSQKRR